MASRSGKSCRRLFWLGLSLVLCTPLAGLSTRHEARDVTHDIASFTERGLVIDYPTCPSLPPVLYYDQLSVRPDPQVTTTIQQVKI